MKQNKTRDEVSMSAKEKKIKRVEWGVLSLLLALVMAGAAFIGGWFGRWSALGRNKQSLLNAIDAAQSEFYQEVDEDTFYKRLYEAFKLDNYSRFYTAEDYREITAERNGQNRDPGFSYLTEESFLKVYTVLEGSSAEEAGVQEGMYFFKYGTSADAKEMVAGSAEKYFAFVSNLKKDQTYFVLCGTSENIAEAKVYEVKNGEKGAGIALTRHYDPMRVFQVIDNSPAYHAGLKRGMYVLKFGKSEKELTAGTSEDFSAMIESLDPDEDENGKKLDSYTFYMQCSFDKEDEDAPVVAVSMKEYQAGYCLYRDSESSYRFLTTDKGMAPVKTDEAMKELDDITAYISITRFMGNAAEEFAELLGIMKNSGRTNLILDLRGNGGGYMDVFVNIAACLLKDAPSGSQKVAFARFRDGSTVSYSTKNSTYNNYFVESSRVSILADEYTASASECLIGALVDYGTVAFSDIYLHENTQGVARTYGKGIMQTFYDVGGGNKLKLTAAEIFWPKSEKSIHTVGVTPSDGAVAIKSTMLPTETDAFLQQAIELIKNKPTSTPSAPSGSY